jgi:hypothetical protein
LANERDARPVRLAANCLYATDSNLGGGAAATQQGFNVRTGGSGALTYNIG